MSMILWACGGRAEHTPVTSDGSGGGATVPPVSGSDLCASFTNALCTHILKCDLVRYRDFAQCQRLLDCQGATQVVDADARGAIAYDPAGVGECLARFASSPCPSDPLAPLPDTYEVLAPCADAITPQLTSGQACSSNAECTVGLFCKKGDDPTCFGTCGPPAVLGEGCRSVPCADGLACGANTTCVPKQHVNDPCLVACEYVPGGGQWSPDCPDGQICTDDIWCDGQLGQCQAGRLQGDPCGQLGAGATSSLARCAVNLWCKVAIGAVAGTCESPGGDGAPCNDSPSPCKPGLHCASYVGAGLDATLGTCVGVSAAGSSCGGDQDCLSGLICVNARCASPALAGGYCFRDVDCAPGLVCDASRCEPPRYPGDPCGADAPCRFARCLSGTCQAYARFGESCTSGGECAVRCTEGRCFDDSICRSL